MRIADFSLTAAPTVLTQIVTTEVGDQRRYQVGNVISTINADSLVPLVPATSLTDIVSARAPGVEVIESSGLTGAGASMRIRGQSSLVLQGDPIVIVDGVRQDNTPGGSYVTAGFAGSVPSPSRINDVSVTDIQSIDFLKGPAASTEYGTDAANGVVVITTRRGGAGRAQWRAGTELSTSAIPVAFPTFYRSWGHTTDGSQSPVQCPLVPFASGFGSAAGTCAVDSVTAWDPLNHPAYSIFGSGSREKYDLSVGGSSDAVRYFVSGALSNETGILRLPAAFSREASGLGLPHSALRPNGEGQRSVRSNTLFPLWADADVSVNAAYLSTHQESPNSQELYRGVIESRPVRDSADGFGYGTGSLDPVYIFGQPIAQQTDRLTGGLTASWRPTRASPIPRS